MLLVHLLCYMYISWLQPSLFWWQFSESVILLSESFKGLNTYICEAFGNPSPSANFTTFLSFCLCTKSTHIYIYHDTQNPISTYWEVLFAWYHTKYENFHVFLTMKSKGKESYLAFWEGCLSPSLTFFSLGPSSVFMSFRCSVSRSSRSLFVCSSRGAVFFFSSKYFFFHKSRAAQPSTNYYLFTHSLCVCACVLPAVVLTLFFRKKIFRCSVPECMNIERKKYPLLEDNVTNKCSSVLRSPPQKSLLM